MFDHSDVVVSYLLIMIRLIQKLCENLTVFKLKVLDKSYRKNPHVYSFSIMFEWKSILNILNESLLVLEVITLQCKVLEI